MPPKATPRKATPVRNKAASAEDKILALKAQRMQLLQKLDEWEEKFAALHGKPSTGKDRQRSREHRELSRLLSDLDGFLGSLQGGSSSAGAPPAPGTADAERKAARGRIKSKMRKWERDFERRHKRPPTEADTAASSTMTKLRAQLRIGESEPVAPDGAEEGFAAAEAAADAAAAALAAQSAGAAGPSTVVVNTAAAVSPLLATWTRGEDYRELLRSRIRSQAAVDGFGEVTPLEAHAAAESFKAWDVDRDGVLSHDEFSKVLLFLASSSNVPLEETAQQRIFKMVNASGTGEIDFNEWLLYFKMLDKAG